jgi:hypothetical protein
MVPFRIARSEPPPNTTRAPGFMHRVIYCTIVNNKNIQLLKFEFKLVTDNLFLL